MIAEKYGYEDDIIIFSLKNDLGVNLDDSPDSIRLNLREFKRCLEDLISRKYMNRGGFFDTSEYYDLSNMVLSYVSVYSNNKFTIEIFEEEGDTYFSITEDMTYNIIEELLGKYRLNEFQKSLDDRYPSCFVERNGSNLEFINSRNNTRLRVNKKNFCNNIISIFKDNTNSVILNDCNGEHYTIRMMENSNITDCCMCRKEFEKGFYLMRNGEISHLMLCLNCTDKFLKIFLEEYNNDLVSYEL
jgi:hypothetical protein